MSLLDKVKKLNNSLPTGKKQTSSFTSDIWHNFKDGDNRIRLVGAFVQVRQHYLAPNKNKGVRGLCIPEAFQGENKLPYNINCADWEIDTETQKKDLTCTICRLNRVAKAFLKKKDSLSKEDNDLFFALMSETNARNQLKWNIIDRDDPYVSIDVEGSKKKVLGLKITSLGMEAWKDISGIFDQLGFDITDPKEGIDLIVTKTSQGRVSYSAKADMKGLTVKQTPFTAEEAALIPHDLKKICGKQTDQEKVLDGLHLDLRTYLDEIEGAVASGNVKVANSTPMAALKEKLAISPASKTTVTVPSKNVASVASKSVAPKASVPDDAADVQLEEETSDWGDFPSEEETK